MERWCYLLWTMTDGKMLKIEQMDWWPRKQTSCIENIGKRDHGIGVIWIAHSHIIFLIKIVRNHYTKTWPNKTVSHQNVKMSINSNCVAFNGFRILCHSSYNLITWSLRKQSEERNIFASFLWKDRICCRQLGWVGFAYFERWKLGISWS